MNDTQSTGTIVNSIVDNVASKFGVAVEKLQPIAETALVEVSRLGAAYCALGLCCFLAIPVGIAMAARWCRGKDIEDCSTPVVLVAAVGMVLFVAGGCLLEEGLLRWLAPTLYLVETVLQGVAK